LGAVQIWRNSLQDEQGAIDAYKRSLALGYTVPLPELFATAGAKFKPDADTLKECVDLIEQTIGALDPA
jgi:oligoendopeptidase F